MAQEHFLVEPQSAIRVFLGIFPLESLNLLKDGVFDSVAFQHFQQYSMGNGFKYLDEVEVYAVLREILE